MYSKVSIKSSERKRRGTGTRKIISGGRTKKPTEWSSFLKNEENKEQLVAFLKKTWATDRYAPRLLNRKVVLICEGEAFMFKSNDGTHTQTEQIEPLTSTQEETDTRVVLYCVWAKDQGYTTVRVRSPDSDIFFILVHHSDLFGAMTVLFDTGVGKHRRIINLTAFAEAHDKTFRAALLGIHAFCGCDTTSAFKGKGHSGPIKAIQKRTRFASTMEQLGTSWEVTVELTKELEKFVCIMYGQPSYHSVDELRHLKIIACCDSGPANAMKNVNLATIPPCKRCLEMHIRRVNYQVAIWKHAHIAKPAIPTPSEEHGWIIEDGEVQPLWLKGDDFVPPATTDVLVDSIVSEEAHGNSEDADLETNDNDLWEIPLVFEEQEEEDA